jgi:hypothetical protein
MVLVAPAADGFRVAGRIAAPPSEEEELRH